MILFIDGKKQSEAVLSKEGKKLILLDFSSEKKELEGLSVPRHILDEYEVARSGRMESRDGYDYIVVREPRISEPSEKRSILVYVRNNVVLIGFEDASQYKEMAARAEEKLDMHDLSLLMAQFFDRLTHNDTEILQSVEERIIDIEEQVIEGDNSVDRNREIGELRRTLLYCKSYYEQLLDIFSDLMENENKFLSAAALKYLKVLADKLDRTYHSVLTQQDLLSQVREEYQTQIDISLNATMKVFTVITAVFLPLTLLVGWYGMNVKVPEFEWEHGYLFVIGLSILITAVTLFIFKKKKWF